MKLRRQIRFHGLKRPKLRQTWNKYNLYNLARVSSVKIDPGVDTFFQQKWKAKAMTRAYHGEHVSEHRWARLFTRRVDSVVPMSPQYMAKSDGSLEARGRGSGLQPMTAHQLGLKKRAQLDEGRDMLTGPGDPSKNYTPHMNMTFAPLERRLDTALFRAMFASSARQARNFIIHGHVKVNGIKVDKPSYHLNPGDMFQVDPEMVMYATGVQKRQGIGPPPFVNPEPIQPKPVFTPRFPRRDISEPISQPSAYRPGEGPPAYVTMKKAGIDPVAFEEKAAEAKKTPDERAKEKQQNLKKLIASTKQFLQVQKNDLNATKKRRLRTWRENAEKLLQKTQRAAKVGTLTDPALMDEIQHFAGNLTVKDVMEGVSPAAKAAAEAKKAAAHAEKEAEKKMQKAKEEEATAKGEEVATKAETPDQVWAELEASASATQKRHETSEEVKEPEPEPEDPESLPYQYPWRPRPWMAAFAIIPRYLEVNPLICSAVYIRHPVARPGRAEVPTPFPEFVNALTFNYYLRRR